MAEKSEEAVCPFCRVGISPEARKCPHCLVLVPPRPEHGGTCPLCKEAIHSQATRCAHCKSWIGRSQPTLADDVPGYASQRGAGLLETVLSDALSGKGPRDDLLSVPPPPRMYCINEERRNGPIVVIVRKCYDWETGKLISEKPVGRYLLVDDEMAR